MVSIRIFSSKVLCVSVITNSFILFGKFFLAGPNSFNNLVDCL